MHIPLNLHSVLVRPDPLQSSHSEWEPWSVSAGTLCPGAGLGPNRPPHPAAAGPECRVACGRLSELPSGKQRLGSALSPAARIPRRPRWQGRELLPTHGEKQPGQSSSVATATVCLGPGSTPHPHPVRLRILLLSIPRILLHLSEKPAY